MHSISARFEAGGVWLAEGERDILFYRARPASADETWRTNYVHPLFAASGALLTEDAPADHPHHRGVFWAWRRILLNGRTVGDTWVGQGVDVLPASPRFVVLADGSGRITAEAVWTCGGEPLARETVQITAHQISGGGRKVAFEISLQALVPGVAIAGSDDDKGYGGFSVRLVEPANLAISSVRGSVEARRAPVQLDGPVAFGWPNSPGLPGRVEIECAIDGAPWRDWILRREQSMQNAAFPGRGRFALPTDVPVRIAASILIVG